MERKFNNSTPLDVKLVMACIILLIGGATISIGRLVYVAYQVQAPDPDRARFMLECTYDWMLSPTQCRDILNGEDPVVPPPEAGC